MAKKEVKLIKCVVLVANVNWNKGDVVEVLSDDIRIGYSLQEVK
jgi:hypothetical protein